MAPIVNDWRAPSIEPLARSTFAWPRAVRRSSRLSPYAARAAGLAWMRTAGFCPPPIETIPTPGSWEIFWARVVSARSSTFERGSTSEVRPRVRMGASAGLTLL